MVTPRGAILVCAALLVILAWSYLVYLDRDMAAAMQYADDMAAMGMPMHEPWRAADVGVAFGMWAVMMAGMMLPSVTPMLLVVAKSEAVRSQSGTAVVFAAGYFAVWTGFSTVAALVQWQLHDAAALSSAMATQSTRIGAAILIVAGLYQMTPVKRACLVRCQNPVSFLVAHWRSGPGGAFRMGLHHGAYCVGCCWALMAILFAVGIMNLLWVAAIGLFVLLERTGRFGMALSRAGGIALIVGGGALLVPELL